LKFRLDKLGHDHPDVALSYNNLGLAYDNKGEYDRGIEYYEKSLKIYLEKLGHDHPDVALSYNNLGTAYYNKGEYDRGIEYKAMAKWSELRTQGEFLENVDPKAFEEEIGIPYSRTIEIEEALKAGNSA
jgi:tetratricopeptide (TPR) repeat protein